MKKMMIGMLILLMVLSVSTIAQGANYPHHRFGPSAHGMGGAFVAVFADDSAIYWNPAALARTDTFAMQFDGGVVFNGLSHLETINNYLDNPTKENQEKVEEIDGVSLHLDFLGGLDLGSYSFGSLAAGRIVNISLDYEVEDNSLIGLANIENFISYGREIEMDNMPLDISNLVVGANAKMLSGGYIRSVGTYGTSGYDENYLDLSVSGFGLDFAAMAQATEMIDVGINIRNLLTLDKMEYGENMEDYSDHQAGDEAEEDVNIYPRRLRIGAAANYPLSKLAVVAADLDLPAGAGAEGVSYHLGTEIRANDFIDVFADHTALRAGFYGEGSSTVFTVGATRTLPPDGYANVSMDLMNGIIGSRYFSASAVLRF